MLDYIYRKYNQEVKHVSTRWNFKRV
jgi:hypothetical protein